MEVCAQGVARNSKEMGITAPIALKKTGNTEAKAGSFSERTTSALPAASTLFLEATRHVPNAGKRERELKKILQKTRKKRKGNGRKAFIRIERNVEFAQGVGKDRQPQEGLSAAFALRKTRKSTEKRITTEKTLRNTG